VSKLDAIVIGAGPNGLVAAATLAKHGRKVMVLESAEEIGGHTRTIEVGPGFRAPLTDDCGWVPTKIEQELGLGIDALKRVLPPRAMSVLDANGELFALSADIFSASNTIRRYSARDAERWPKFAEQLHKFTTILAELYQLTPPDIDTKSIGEVFPLIGVGRKLRKLGREDMTEFLRVMPMSVQDLLDDTFESEQLKAAIAASAIRDMQQGPRSGGTTYNLLHYMVGAHKGSIRARARWLDGPDAFVRAVADVAHKHGAAIRRSSRVSQILVNDHTVRGVALEGGEEVAANTVISTADPRRTLLELVDPVWLDPEAMLAVKNIKMRGCSAYVFYALNGKVPNSQEYSATMSLTATTRALEQAADAAKYGEVSKAPHIEFFIPTERWPSLAPSGKQVVVACAQFAPYTLRNGEWDAEQRRNLERKVTAAITRALPKFADLVAQSLVLGPTDIEDEFGVTEGAMTQGELTLDQILFMRPIPGWGHYDMPVEGLLLGGAGAHPGPGILGGAGWWAAKRVLSRR
jgi:phytoene dehydrogenase-like protein